MNSKTIKDNSMDKQKMGKAASEKTYMYKSLLMIPFRRKLDPALATGQLSLTLGQPG